MRGMVWDNHIYHLEQVLLGYGLTTHLKGLHVSCQLAQTKHFADLAYVNRTELSISHKVPSVDHSELISE